MNSLLPKNTQGTLRASMSKTLPGAIRCRIERMLCSLMAALLAFPLFFSTPALSEGSVDKRKVVDNMVLYFAFYYDSANNLLQVEAVSNPIGRDLNFLKKGQLKKVPALPCTPASPCQWENSGRTDLMDSTANFAIYYGIDDYPPPIQTVMLNPLAIESVKGQLRALQLVDQIVQNPAASCSFPYMCLCGTIANCCLCVHK